MSSRKLITRRTGSRGQHESALRTYRERVDVTSFEAFRNHFGPEGKGTRRREQMFDVDYHVAELEAYASRFLKKYKVDEKFVSDPLSWQQESDHIPGVEDAISLLVECFFFHRERKESPELAYAHLLRCIHSFNRINLAMWEPQIFAGAARIKSASDKTTQKEIRQSKFLDTYFELRSENKSSPEARRLAALRNEIGLSTAKHWYTLDELEKKRVTHSLGTP
jgi:hypothetical protein